MEPPTSLSVLKSLLSLAFLKIGGADARSVQKTPAGVLFVRRGLFFVKRRRRCLAHECTSVYICGLRVCKQTRYCSISRTSLSVLKSLSPLAFLQIDRIDTRREQKLTAGTLKNERPCSFFSCEFAVRTRFCLEPPPSVAVLQILLPLAFLKIDGTDTRREQK